MFFSVKVVTWKKVILPCYSLLRSRSFTGAMASGRLRTRKQHVQIEVEEDQKPSLPSQVPDAATFGSGVASVGADDMTRTKKAKVEKVVPGEVKVEKPDSESESKPIKIPGRKRVIKTVTKADLVKVEKYVPENWEAVLENIQKMRASKDAPVDTMGCERTMEEHVEPKVRRFQTLVSLMLSSQTKDPVTFAAMERLKTGVPLTVQKILDIPEDDLGKLIIPVGFWRRKALYLKKTCEVLRDQYGDDIPGSVEELCSLPGVGPKMAYICMNVAWEKNAGIGVDTHVHRISNRLKWSGMKESKTPEETRKALESWLPEDMWQEINILLVGFGQQVCLPIRPKCETCLNLSLCKYGQAELRTRKYRSPQKPKKEPSEEEGLGTSKYFSQ